MNLPLKILPMSYQLLKILKLSIINSLTDQNEQQYSKAQKLNF